MNRTVNTRLLRRTACSLSYSAVANETFKTEAGDSICSNQSQWQIVDENQWTYLFKNVAKSKRKSRKSKTSTGPSRRSTRETKKVEKLQIGSNKGQLYD